MKWRPIPGEFDDYIAARKDNNYQSLHTAVIFDDYKPLEVQIRTEEMHDRAEYGIAAHWRYKENQANINQSYEQKISWLRSLLNLQQDGEDADDLVEGWKSDVFKDRVYVLTPQGDIIDLPAGSTPLTLPTMSTQKSAIAAEAQRSMANWSHWITCWRPATRWKC